MEDNSKLVHELVGFVREQRKINARLEQSIHRLDRSIEEQRELSRQQMKFNRAFAKEMRVSNQRWQDLRVDSEKRFRAFYHLIVNLQRRG